jgi:hypothetical protein
MNLQYKRIENQHKENVKYAEYKKLAQLDFESKGKGHMIKDEW